MYAKAKFVVEKDLWCPAGFKPVYSGYWLHSTWVHHDNYLCLFWGIVLHHESVKPLKFVKIMFKKKNLGCFTFFPINILTSMIYIHSLGTEYTITDW